MILKSCPLFMSMILVMTAKKLLFRHQYIFCLFDEMIFYAKKFGSHVGVGPKTKKSNKVNAGSRIVLKFDWWMVQMILSMYLRVKLVHALELGFTWVLIISHSLTSVNENWINYLQSLQKPVNLEYTYNDFLPRQF